MPSKRERPEPEEQPLYRSLDDPDTMRLLMQNLGEGIYITDPQGRILDANPAFLEIFGVSSLEELSKYKVANLLTQPEQRRLELEQLERDGSVQKFELEIVRPDGQRRTVLDTTYLVRH